MDQPFKFTSAKKPARQVSNTGRKRTSGPVSVRTQAPSHNPVLEAERLDSTFKAQLKRMIEDLAFEASRTPTGERRELLQDAQAVLVRIRVMDREV